MVRYTKMELRDEIKDWFKDYNNIPKTNALNRRAASLLRILKKKYLD